MAQEVNLNPEDVQELEAAQGKDVKESQEQQKVEINLDSSVIIAPPFKFISNLKRAGGNDEDPIFALMVANDATKVVFKGHSAKLRQVKAGLIQAMTAPTPTLYYVDVNSEIIDENSLIVETLA